jgi:hypothetical protein
MDYPQITILGVVGKGVDEVILDALDTGASTGCKHKVGELHGIWVLSNVDKSISTKDAERIIEYYNDEGAWTYLELSDGSMVEVLAE